MKKYDSGLSIAALIIVITSMILQITQCDDNIVILLLWIAVAIQTFRCLHSNKE